MFARIDRFFLFRPAPDKNWSLQRRSCWWLWRLGLVFTLSAVLGMVLLLFAYADYSWAVFTGYFRDPLLLLLNTLPVMGLIFILWGITGCSGLGYLLGGGCALALSLGNYYKLIFRDDPVIFRDLLILREACAMGGEHYPLFLDRRVIFAAGCFLISAAILFLFARGPRKNLKSRLILLVCAMLPLPFLWSASLDSNLYESTGDYTHLKRWAPTQEYLAHGFIYPFIHSVSDAFAPPPPGYDTDAARALLDAFTDADIPADKKINLITIMREAYVDFSRFDIEGFDNSAYDLYHSLRDQSLSGDLMVNIFAGGTVDSERCFLTGSYDIRDYRANTNSYLWYLRQQGYTVEGAHPFNEWFYNRKNVNRYLGFEDYRFLEGDFEHLTGADFPEDKILYPEVYRDFQRNKPTGKPYFSFVLNVQSHGPYPTQTYQGSRIFLSGDYTAECKNAMNHYMASIHAGDQALWDLTDSLRRDPEPVVLLVFSDHLPWMGNSNSFYAEMGIPIDPADETGFYNHYTTEYLIWANDAAKELLQNDFTGRGPTISPCYLMNLLFETLGWEGPAFMQAMDVYRGIFPVVTTLGYTQVEGRLVQTIPPAYAPAYQDFLNLQYYWQEHFLFG